MSEIPKNVPPASRNLVNIITIVLLALLLVGGGIATAVLMMGQQQQLDRLTQLQETIAGTTPESPMPSESPSESPESASLWDQVNGNWCMGTDCLAIAGLSSPPDDIYVQTGDADANGCVTGFSGPSAGPQITSVAYCPAGAAFPKMTDPSGTCHSTEDVTRERLYIYLDCAEPYYRD